MNPHTIGLPARRRIGHSSHTSRQPARASPVPAEPRTMATPGPQPPGAPPPAVTPSPTPPRLVAWLWRDRVLLGACVLVGLLIGYQLAVTLLRPAWSGPVTDWLRAALAWPELLTIVSVSLWLSRAPRRGAASWWMWSAAFLSYAVARTLWTVYDQLLFHEGVPFPTFPDLFFVLQYPFFFLAVILLPCIRRWGSRLLIPLDGLLVVGAAAALSGEFLMLPLSRAGGLSPLARAVSLAYPVGDLFVLAALTRTLLRPSRYYADRLVLAVLVVAVLCLMTADSWVAWLLRSPPHVYSAGDPPDLFWMAFYLLVPLASLVQLRLAQRARLARGTGRPSRDVVGEPSALRRPGRPPRQDVAASLQVFVPIVVALLASLVLVIHATMDLVHVGWRQELLHFALPLVLLLLVVARQEVVFLENAQLRRQQEVARAAELALVELNRHKDEFLGIVAHELRTPLTSLRGYIELLARRARRQQEGGAGVEDHAMGEHQGRRSVAVAPEVIVECEDSIHRMSRLVDDLLDSARISAGRLSFDFALRDLCAIVWKAVEEQRVLAAERTIRLELPTPSQPVPIRADGIRVGQVVANYLTNALKYSSADRPVVVRVTVEGAPDATVEGAVARVAVRDEGIGVPLQEQARVWERFPRIMGSAVQSGSGVGLGLGLFICKTIIEGHHGQVGLDSVPGRGSTFWFSLPLAEAAADTATEVTAGKA
jgi:signal transduction histidine kinase